MPTAAAAEWCWDRDQLAPAEEEKGDELDGRRHGDPDAVTADGDEESGSGSRGGEGEEDGGKLMGVETD
jgi:hypothetical protein